MTVTRNQFASNERAANIREKCLEIVRVLESSSQEEGWPRIESAIQALRLYGITPDMHIGKQKKAYEDPVMMAEYVAGQILANVKPYELLDRMKDHTIINTTYRMLDAENEP